MGFEKGKPRPPGAGRRPGSTNKTTANAKEAIEKVAEGLGGWQGMLKWAKSSPDNERVFWGTIYPKLVPKDINIEGEAAFRIIFETALEMEAKKPQAGS
jgi:hypothetical protein